MLLAQWRGPKLTELGPAEGLPAIIHHVATDSTGYRYFATNMGLYRYDGHQFTFYGHDPMDPYSIGPGEILNLLVARDGLLWLTMRFGGLNSFNPKTGRFKRYPLPEMSFRSIPSAQGLYEDTDGTLWVGGMHFRLLAFDRHTEQFTIHTPDWINPEKDGGRLTILSITPHPHHPDQLWLSVLDYAAKNAMLDSYGLVLFDKSTNTFEETPYTGYIRYVDSTKVMWGSHWGNFIVRFDPATMQYDTFQHQYHLNGKSLVPLTRDIISYKGDLLVASSLTIMGFDGKNFNTKIPRDPKREIYSLYSDPEENLWIGTNQGVQVLNPADQHIRYFSLDQFGMYTRIFPGNLAYDQAQDVMYLAHTQHPYPSGYYQIPLYTENSNAAKFISTPFPVEGLAMDQHHQLWAAGGGALYHLDPVKQDFDKIPLSTLNDQPLPGIIAMNTSEEGWIGMHGSRELIWFHPDNMKTHRIRLRDLPGSAYAKSFDNGIDGFSFGTDHTAYLYSNEVHIVDLQSEEVRALKYDQRANPNFQRILYVGEAPDGYIWMSTFVHIGKYHLEGDSLVLLESFGLKEGMISSGATEMHMDLQGRVWTFTPSGMNAIDPTTKEVRYFSTKEGLPIPFLDPRQVITLSDGRIATVCSNGMIVFPPDKLWKAASPSDKPIIFKQIRVDGITITGDKSVNELDTLYLKADHKGADIEFQALAFPTDYRMEYSYRISEIQPDWISIGQNNLVTLPTLSPGVYTFEVKAGHPQNQSPVKSLLIVVATPLIQRWWFILLISIALLALIYYMVRRRIQNIRKEENEKAIISKQMAELELKALRSQMNPHFMFNSLNSIKNYILQAEPKLAAEYLSNFAHLIRMILQNSREKAITLQEELDTLILYIELEQIRFEHKFAFSCEINDDVPMEQTMIPPMLLQPFVENAIWHGLMHKKENGHLALRFSKIGNRIACVIDDDGVGRNKAAEMKSLSSTKYKSMGMGITRDRIEIMNKMDALGITIDVIDKTDASGKPAGTSVIVNIPSSADL
jgi:streptogramin lyase